MCSNYFAEAVTKLKNNTIPLTNFIWKPKENFHQRTATKFKLGYISNVFILKQLKILKRKKSTGVDGLPAGMLKDCRTMISKQLCYILNLSIKTGTVPALWKIAKIVPIHKKGSAADPANYRPISVLPILSKLLEKAVHSQLINHLEKEKLLTERQFGYRRNKSTNMATTLLLDNIRKHVDKGHLVGATFIDLSKAFDTISHAKIIEKLPAYGVHGKELEWITDYLFHRKQYVQIGDNISNLQPCYNGVPQGSILGPLLFLIFFNDFIDILQKTESIMYADDTVIFCAGKCIQTIEKDLSDDLDKVKTYFDSNELVINMNIGKTEVMLFGTAQRIAKQLRPLNVFYNNQKVNNTNAYTYLGHQLDSTLTLNTDFDNAYKRSTTRLKLLAKIRNFLTQNAAMSIYMATILPILSYSLAIKLHLSTTQSQKLRSLENRASKIVGKKVKSAEKCMKLQTLSLMWKCLKKSDVLGNDFTDYFDEIRHNKNTRNVGLSLRLPKCKLEYSKKSFYFLGAKYFNELPLSIREENSFTKFYRSLNKFFT